MELGEQRESCCRAWTAWKPSLVLYGARTPDRRQVFYSIFIGVARSVHMQTCAWFGCQLNIRLYHISLQQSVTWGRM